MSKLPVNGPAKTPKEVLLRAQYLECLAANEKDADKKARLKLAAKRSRWVAKALTQIDQEEAERLTAEALEKAQGSARQRKKPKGLFR